MKQIVLAAMVVMTMAGSVSAETSAWDYFWGTALPHAFDPKLNGWDDFWYQCQDPDKNAGDCAGTVAAGVAMALTIPIVIVAGAVVVGSAMPAAGTIYIPITIAGGGGGSISL